jgi:hypothetical protein
MTTSYESVIINGKEFMAYKINDRLWLGIVSVLEITHSTEAELLAFCSAGFDVPHECLNHFCDGQTFDLAYRDRYCCRIFNLAYLDFYCGWLGYDNPSAIARTKERAPENVNRLERLIKDGFTLDGLLASSVRLRAAGSKNRSAVVSEAVLRAAEKLIEGEWDENC